jgi:raffinose/stachyose/melibiose transport system substrate-binding protein
MEASQMKRSIIRAGAVTLAGVVLFAAAGCSATASSSSDEKVTLTVQHLSFLTGAGEVVAKEFEKKHPNVTVKIQSITADQFNTNATLLASDDTPDVAMVPFNRVSYTQLVKAHLLEPLDDVWKTADLKKRYPSGVTDALLQGGDTPYEATLDTFYYQAVLYNKALFSKYGIAEPTDHRFASYDQLKSAVATLKANGVGGIAIPGAESYEPGSLLDPILATTASDSALKNYLSTGSSSVKVTSKYTASDFVKAVEATERYVSDGIFQDGFLGTKSDQAVALFQSGGTGMVFGGSSDFASMQKAGVDVGWALLPSEGARASEVIGSATDAFAVPTNSKHKDLAKEFLELYLTKEMQTQALLPNGLVPVTTDVDPTAVSGIPTGLTEMIQDASKNGLQSGWTSTVPGDYGQASVGPLLQAYWQNQSSAQDVASGTQTAFETWRSKN